MSLTGQETLETAPTDKRFPTTNQAKHCYMCAAPCPLSKSRKEEGLTPTENHDRYYNSWHQCKYDHSDEEPQCQKLKQWAMSMCPMNWVRLPRPPVHRLLLTAAAWPPRQVEKWEEQRENGTYPGPVPGEVAHNVTKVACACSCCSCPSPSGRAPLAAAVHARPLLLLASHGLGRTASSVPSHAHVAHTNRSPAAVATTRERPGSCCSRCA